MYVLLTIYWVKAILKCAIKNHIKKGNWSNITSRKGKLPRCSKSKTGNKRCQQWKISSFSFAICQTKRREVNKINENNFKFNIKSKIKHDYRHDITYYVKCPVETCREDYIGETVRRLSERVIDHSGLDKNYHVLKHCIEKENKLPFLEDFMILGANFKKNKFRREFQSHCISRKTLSYKHSSEICSAKTV